MFIQTIVYASTLQLIHKCSGRRIFFSFLVENQKKNSAMRKDEQKKQMQITKKRKRNRERTGKKETKW